MSSGGIGLRNGVKCVVVAVVAALCVLVVSSRMAITYVWSPLTPLFIVLLGFCYRGVHSTKYPLGIVTAQILAFVSLGYLWGSTTHLGFIRLKWLLSSDFAHDPFLASIFQLSNAVVFMFPQPFASFGHRLFAWIKRKAIALNPIEVREPAKFNIEIAPTWINPLKAYTFTVVVGVLALPVIIFAVDTFRRFYVFRY